MFNGIEFAENLLCFNVILEMFHVDNRQAR